MLFQASLFLWFSFSLAHLSLFRLFFNHFVSFFYLFHRLRLSIFDSPHFLPPPTFSLTALNAFFMKNLFMFLLFKFTFFVYLCYLCHNTLSNRESLCLGREEPCRAPSRMHLAGFHWELERLAIRPHSSFTMRFLSLVTI